MITGRTGHTAAPPQPRVRCARCGQALAAGEAFDDVEPDGEGSEQEILVHWACATPRRRRQIVHDYYGRDVPPANGSALPGRLWDVLGPDEREIVLAMLKRDDLELRTRVATVLRGSLDADGRAAWDERERQQSSELRTKALRAVGLPDEA